MSRPKYEEKTVLEIVGILDYNEDNQLVVIVDESTYLLEDILKNKLGQEVQFKFTEV